MKVEIDGNSGFCGGVIRAIGTAERYLEEHGGSMYSLGSIVHNEMELDRLEKKGLFSLERSELERMEHSAGGTVLIRAHGEPPEVYGLVRDKGFSLIDCTCPVVLKLQKDIRDAYSDLKGRTPEGQLVIFGKIGHPEVLGLVGQVGGDAVVIESPDRLDELESSGSIDTSRDIAMFSQTTMSPIGYEKLKVELGSRMRGGAVLEVHDTICQQVARRHRDLSVFASSHDVVVFVSGKHSSNGSVLSELCRKSNPRTFNVSSVGEIRPEWFRPGDNVGVSGATSTPGWLLEEVAQAIENLQ